jgi:hypothetical protein
MNFTAAIINLIDHLPWLRDASVGVEDQPREDHPGTTFLDNPQRGPAAKSQHVSRFYISGAFFPAVLVLPCGKIFRRVGFILPVHDSCELNCKSPSSEESLSCSSNSRKIVEFAVILVDIHYKGAVALWL